MTDFFLFGGGGGGTGTQAQGKKGDGDDNQDDVRPQDANTLPDDIGERIGQGGDAKDMGEQR